jgi:hypothetical protein
MMDKEEKSMEQRAWSKDEEEKSMDKRALNERPRRRSPLIRSEKGLALVTVLVLSLICLSVISTLLYMVIQGTRVSGFYKRYETARESALGGAEIGADLISERGEMVVLPLLNLPDFCDCGNPEDPTDNLYGGAVSCLCDKLCDETFIYPGPVLNWTNCAVNDTALDPTNNPDIQFDLAGFNTTYRVSVKIVDTIRGNSDLSGEELGGSGVVSSTSGLITAPPMPYLHRVEINSEDTGNLNERAKFSVLYAF